MKKYNFGWLLLCVAAFTLGACSQDDDFMSVNDAIAKSGKKLFNFEVKLSAETRTTFDENYNLIWSEGDRLSFFTDAGEMCVPSEPYISGSNYFSVEFSADATTVHAYYPEGMITTREDDPNGYFTIPADQYQQQAGELNGWNLPMMAKAELTDEGDNVLAFSPLASLIAFNVYGAEGEEVKYIAFKTGVTKTKANGELTYYFDYDAYSREDYYETDYTGLGYVILNVPYAIPRTKPADKSGYVYLTVTDAEYEDNSFVVTTDKHIYVFHQDKLDLTDKYKVQVISMDLANAEKYDVTALDNLNDRFEDPEVLNSLLETNDVNQDGIISTFETKLVKSFNCSWRSVKSLKGIELLTEMEVLYCGGNSELEEINLPDNIAANLIRLNCDEDKLTSLDVSNCVNLQELSCNENQLTSLDVSKCPNLTTLLFDINQVSSIDLSNCPKLSDLNCSNNLLTTLDVSNCPSLTSLYCTGNQFTSLDVSQCSNLLFLVCHSNQLTSLDVSSCPNLMYMECQDNQLTSFDFSNNSKLYYMYGSSKNIMLSLRERSCLLEYIEYVRTLISLFR